jgi:hypothetical protein
VRGIFDVYVGISVIFRDRFRRAGRRGAARAPQPQRRRVQNHVNHLVQRARKVRSRGCRREAPQGTGVESSSLIRSYQDGEEKATTFKSRTICGASFRIRLL